MWCTKDLRKCIRN